MYNLTMKPERGSDDYRTILLISDDNGEREYSDGGEPEDNLFVRDWYWVPNELRKAYKQGVIDGEKKARGE